MEQKYNDALKTYIAERNAVLSSYEKRKQEYAEVLRNVRGAALTVSTKKEVEINVAKHLTLAENEVLAELEEEKDTKLLDIAEPSLEAILCKEVGLPVKL